MLFTYETDDGLSPTRTTARDGALFPLSIKDNVLSLISSRSLSDNSLHLSSITPRYYFIVPTLYNTQFERYLFLLYTDDMKKKSIIIALLAVLIIMSAQAEDYYETGSQVFTITAGVDLPFINSYRNESGSWEAGLWWGDEGSHFNIGGYGSIDYEVFVTSKVSVGGEIGYQFNRCSDQKLFTQVPLLVRATYVPLQGKFEIPISAGLGFNYLSYNEKSMFTLTLSLTVGARYFFTDNWSFGLKSGIQFTPELYVNTKKNGLHTSIPSLLFASYRN